MIEFIAVVVFLALIWFFLKSRKKQSSTLTLKNAPESAKPIKPADKAVSPTETITTPANEKAPTSSPATRIVKPENKPVVAKQTHQLENNLLPQDSMLKRHYLTNLRAIITSLSPQPPTDSALSRHYNTQIAAKIEQCLNNEQAVAQLISQYELSKTTTPAPIVKVPEAIIEPLLNTETASENEVLVPQAKISKIPNDSMLRRHYLTHLYTQVAANLPTRPTDSTLRRHYNAMLENEVKNQLTQ